MRLGFVTAILPERSFEQIVEFASKSGYSCIEVMCWPKGKADRRYAGVTHLDPSSLDAARIQSVHSLCTQYGITISGLGYYPNPLSPDRGEAELAAAHLTAVIDSAADLGVGVVNSFVGRDPSLSIDACWPRLLDVWRPLVRHAEQRGVKIGIENCPMLFGPDEWPGGKNLATSPVIWRRLFHDIPSPNFGLNFDPSHFVWQQMDYIAPLYEFRDRIFHIHAKDARLDRAALEAQGVLSYPKLWHTPKIPGMGDVRWGAFIGGARGNRLRRRGRRGSGRQGVRRLARKTRGIARLEPKILAAIHCQMSVYNSLDASRRPGGGSGDNGGAEAPELSVLIPVFNELKNVEPLHAELTDALQGAGLSYELIFVDDGSTDGTSERLELLQNKDPGHVRAAFLRRNCGQTAALSAALDLARGEILVPMDGDLQNDPADIPRLIAKLEEGFDVVSGWRKDRKDDFVTRKIPSRLANKLVARLSGVALHDFGCTLKAYRRSVLEGVRLYGEMHRFIPIFASWQGGKVVEMVVNHRPRTAGKTKYGLGRTFNVVLDLILIRFFQKYAQRPMHLFGRIGLLSILFSTLSFLAMLYFKYMFRPSKSFVETPLPTLTVMFFLGGAVSILMGILAEMIMRTYYESQAKTTYLLREVRQEGNRGQARAVTTIAGDPTLVNREGSRGLIS